MINVQKELGLINMSDLVKKEIGGIFETKSPTEEQNKKYIRTESERAKKPADDSKYKYARSDLVEKIIKNCRGVKNCNDGINRMKKEEQREIFRSLLGFKEHDIMKVIEKTTLESLRDTVEGENIQTHYKVLGSENFHDDKLAVEIDEKDHQDRDNSREIERQKTLEKNLAVNLLELILIKKILIFFRVRMKYLGTLKNQIENQLKN